MKKSILIVLFIITLISCGSRGDLILEPGSLPLKIDNLSLSQVGTAVNLSFTFPTLLSDKTSLDKANISKIYVYHSTKVIPKEQFRKKADVVIKTKKPFKLISSIAGGRLLVKVPLSVRKLDNKEHSFGIIYYNNKERAPMSVIRSIKTVIPPAVIKNISIKQERKLVLIKWTKPDYDIARKKISKIAGFNIYRRIEKDNTEIEDKEAGTNVPEGKDKSLFTKINTKLVTKEFYEDENVSVNGKYFYRVSTVYNKKIESSLSKIVSVELNDIYPPDVPDNLFVFRGNGFMLLNWEAVKDSDISHYVIYRRNNKWLRFRKLAGNIVKSSYKDKKVIKGVEYFYFVIAVDKKGNKSEPSKKVHEKY